MPRNITGVCSKTVCREQGGGGSFSLPQTLNDLPWPDIPSCYNVPNRRLFMYIILFFYKLSPAFSKKIRGDACKLTVFCATWFVAQNPLTDQ